MTNNKLNSLRAERRKNDEKIAKLNDANTELDGNITELENTCIIGIVREYALTPELLAELLSSVKKGVIPGKAALEVEHEN